MKMRLVLFAAAALCAGCESTPILLYHSVGEPFLGDRWVSAAQFREQMEYLLAEGYTPINARYLDAIELDGAPAPPKPIVLTFDDGFRNFYLQAYPVLRELHLNATLFLPTQRIGATEAHRVRMGIEYLIWQEVKEMAAAGIDVQSHSITHPRLRDLSLEQARQEIEGSKAELERELGHPITVFAYPGGSENAAIRDLVEQAGYRSALSVSAGLNGRFDRQRISVHSGVDREQFGNMIEGTWWGATSGAR